MRNGDDPFPGNSEADRTHHDALLNALGDLHSNGTFATFDPLFSVGPVDLALTVEGLGRVELPLQARDVALLADGSELAPFGTRDETIVDITIRNTREIDAERVSFGEAWDSLVEQALRRVKADMGFHPAVP